MQQKKDIRDQNQEALTAFLLENNQPKFRASQIYNWVWKNGLRSFQDMNNIPKDLRTLLDDHYFLHPLTISNQQISSDKTVKFLFSLSDGNKVEGVLIPTKKRITACISSQVGCSLDCKFCATGQLKRMRNLKAYEIFDQAWAIDQWGKKHYDRGLTNIVFMGMGEPLLNHANVHSAIDRICDTEGMGMSKKRITVSTAGIAKMIEKLGADNVKYKLALSLHAANDQKRNLIMPINESNSLDKLKAAMVYYYNSTGNKVTFEYLIMKDFNDEISDAKELIDLCKQIPSKVNIIEFNPVEGIPFSRANEHKVLQFQAYLEKNGVVATIRKSRGMDIDAACGQLANKEEV